MGKLRAFSDLREHAGKDFQAEIFFISQPVGAALNHPDLVVEPFHEAERDLVFRPAVSSDAVPVLVDHLGELLEGLESLTLQGSTPVIEELPCPGFTTVVPELAERLLEEVGCV